MSLPEQRRLAATQMHFVVAAWINRSPDIADPVVLVADSEDAVGKQYARTPHGTIVKVVSGAELATKLDPATAATMREADTSACFAVFRLLDGSLTAYVNKTASGLALEDAPGELPTPADAGGCQVPTPGTPKAIGRWQLGRSPLANSADAKS